jgi:hypothetical protein
MLQTSMEEFRCKHPIPWNWVVELWNELVSNWKIYIHKKRGLWLGEKNKLKKRGLYRVLLGHPGFGLTSFLLVNCRPEFSIKQTWLRPQVTRVLVDLLSWTKSNNYDKIVVITFWTIIPTTKIIQIASPMVFANTPPHKHLTNYNLVSIIW